MAGTLDAGIVAGGGIKLGAPPTGVTGTPRSIGVGGSVAASSGDLGAPLGNGSTSGGRCLGIGTNFVPTTTTAIVPRISFQLAVELNLSRPRTANTPNGP